ncbi:alanyl-tRNA synthetase [Catalinimonas alkaloidigena]|uniref:Alanine--tRNA ligase n=1 Tax=Catalinimonas alkaloidigena TaxID=1075417 RepID=A0A1G9BYT1_9BACT|nr:alanine--tRNA ligase [Catalinimonas alkaloidigena]SDK44611.1 alanyl-tRNA synthetase [Catalinimonas alkaloidigena]
MKAKEIRQTFLEFFKSKGHQIVPSAPLVVKNDPTLMFTNAGMNQFKDYFLGNKPARNKRVADTQKCLRVSGKHNDLEEVGHDTYHHTMFEMLGNWSFGDYFKKEALQWSWELLTEVYKLPADRLYASVFEGDAADGLPADEEALALWREMLPDDHILYGNKKDNFWEMGDTGPCGPCSEIHIDLRSDEERAKVPGRELVNRDNPLVVEIWNNVFIQFNRMADGSLVPLPEKHVDTGMGFERLCMAIQGKTSNYDTDVFQPMIQFIAREAGTTYGADPKKDIAMRVLADHIRAISFSIADGQLPSNQRAGYVIRRILRRAVRYAYTFLGFKEPFLYRLVPLLADQFADVFPELKAQQDFVARVIQEEESAFLRTLETGLRRLDALTNENTSGVIDGATVFELYDTFGFPVDLTALIARERGMRVDEAGFQQEMGKQKERSRSAAAVDRGDWVELTTDEESEFIGYDHLESRAHLVKYRAVDSKGKKRYQLVLDKTPFYAESGGQVGDTGYLETNEEKIPVLNTVRENDLIIHETEQLPSDLTAELHAVVDTPQRKLTENNHSATHLLHAALRQVLGSHVQQKGSLVTKDYLRFDFSHFSKVTEEELAQIEQIVNRKIRENIPIDERRNVPIEDAKGMGAMALFGEKYGDYVRVITFDPAYSVELCGGTHVPSTGQIGFFKIISESSVAAGVRRIEAYTADRAEQYINEQLAQLEEIKALLKNPRDLPKALQGLIDERNAAQKQIELLQLQEAQQVKQDLLSKVRRINDMAFIAEKVHLPNADAAKQIAFELRSQVDNLFLVLAAEVQEKPMITVMISDELVKEKGYNAGQIVRDLAKDIKGGGGGQPFYATAGGKDVSGLDHVLVRAAEMI